MDFANAWRALVDGHLVSHEDVWEGAKLRLDKDTLQVEVIDLRYAGEQVTFGLFTVEDMLRDGWELRD